MNLREQYRDATFILKCTRDCNLRCTYCTDHRSASPKMDVAFLAAFYDSLARDLELNHISFIWHGGEPLNLGIGFLRKLFFLQRRILSAKARLRNTLQTNGSLVDDEFAAHFKAYNFTVGVSIDGPADIHNHTRRTAGGLGSFECCMDGVRTLQRHDVRFGVLTVVSEEHLRVGPTRLMEFFRKENIHNYALLSLRRNWPDPADAAAYTCKFGKFMQNAAELWFAKDTTEVHVRELDSKLDRFFGLPTRICKDAGACVGKYFGIEPDGGIWHCDKFLGDERFHLGTVGDGAFSEIMRSPRLAALMWYETEVRQQCAGCKWFCLCGGGCLYECACFHAKGGRTGTSDCPSFTLFECMSRLIAESPIIVAAAHSQSRGVVLP